ncbi:uncharacterized protein LOC114283023 isoform X2 [Camellia sinensis]|uniref:uncharacterized protein LOC114283023 isoform X2 n=1 Tax=Camellia sinensis TaxID=4442 RepID=UPI001035C43A|nr:uncharacterized protein LOC114283023 isoform X2 [Camellia sinensis]XP_028081660.1 uncharacterized protein LOC114283023 isoform X2 [Camellia sinensis]
MLLFNNTITFCTNRRSLFIGFITDMSKLGRLDGNGTMIISTTMQVMDMKESAVPLSSPASPAPRRSVAKSQEQQVNLAHASASASASAAEPPVSGSDAIENGNNQEGEADGCSIYIKGLLLNATHALLENEFKRFGPIKTVGVQVKSNEQGFCFGFVEFEVASAVQTAIEASPLTINILQVVVEEKRSTNSRGKLGFIMLVQSSKKGN